MKPKWFQLLEEQRYGKALLRQVRQTVRDWVSP